MAAWTARWLGGGDGEVTRISPLPRPMDRFLVSCLQPGQSMRPQDAWALHDEFDRMLLGLYGSPSFTPLEF
jgi:hypothetical protein